MMTKEEQAEKEVCQDRLLWQKLRQGSVEALGSLYDLYVDRLFGVGLCIQKDRQVLQDELHDLFLDLYKYHQNLADVENVCGYLVTSFKRKLYRHYGLQKITVHQDLEHVHERLVSEDITVASHEETIIEQNHIDERRGRLDDVLSGLTDHQRSILRQRFAEEKSYEEIADDLHVSVPSARTLVYRTLKSLRKAALSLLF